nr:transcription initiation factor TFIID subunit 13 [Tanacetum cinerariifolium]
MSKARPSASQPSETSFKRKRGVFQKDLQHMMYGFGDDSNEIDHRLLREVSRPEDEVYQIIVDNVKMKLMSLRMKRSKQY